MRRLGWLAALTAVVALAAPVAAQANAVTDWNRIANDTLVVIPGPAGGAPPHYQLNLAMVQGAVYDAVNATEPKHYRPYLLNRRVGATASKDAAVATAAYRVLYYIVNTAPAALSQAQRDALLSSLANAYANALAPIGDTPFARMGVTVGNAAAQAMIDSRQGDGRFGPSPWVPNSAAGHWQPLVNPNGTLQLDPTPWVGNVRPFLMQSQSQFRTAGPALPLTSAAWAADFNEVKLLGRSNSLVRTSDQTYIARWWQSPPPYTWNAVARDLVNAAGTSVADSARLFAMENLAAADAGINCWNDKYFYDFWRPWNAIPRADEDGNAATVADPTWTALITAPYPEHPSGHLCNDSAHLGVLRNFFGTDEKAFNATSRAFPNDPPRHFNRFSDAQAEIVEARIWAGLHFRTADVQSEILGANVVEYMLDNYFQKVGNG